MKFSDERRLDKIELLASEIGDGPYSVPNPCNLFIQKEQNV